jgi:hypothetical protein
MESENVFKCGPSLPYRWPRRLVAERPAERKITAVATHNHNLNFRGEKKMVQLGQYIPGLRMYNTVLWHRK